MEQLANRPFISGSFKHRSIQDMQPRDVFRFWFVEKVLTDDSSKPKTLTDENGNELGIGGYEERTVETHTITHENGGSISEITYRRGII